MGLLLRFYLGRLGKGSDTYEVHVPRKEFVRLTHQESTPNTGCRKLEERERVFRTSRAF